MAFSYLGPNITNIFTDASTTNTSSTMVSVGSGFVVTRNNSLVDQKVQVFHNSTSSFGEIYAVFMAANWIYRDAWIKRYRYGQDPLAEQHVYNIFSDSQYTVGTLSKWIKEWFNNVEYQYCNGNGNHWFPIVTKANGKYPAHYECLLSTVKTLIDSNVYVNLFHIKGHVDLNHDNEIKNALNMFKHNPIFKKKELKSNPPSKNTMISLIQWNHYIDKLSRDILHNHLKTVCFEYGNGGFPQWPIMYNITPMDLVHYKHMVR